MAGQCLAEVSNRGGSDFAPPAPPVPRRAAPAALPQPAARHAVPRLLGVDEHEQLHHVRRGLSLAVKPVNTQFCQYWLIFYEYIYAKLFQLTMPTLDIHHPTS